MPTASCNRLITNERRGCRGKTKWCFWQNDFYPIKRDSLVDLYRSKTMRSAETQQTKWCDSTRRRSWTSSARLFDECYPRGKNQFFNSFLILLSMCILNNIDECFILCTREKKHKINPTKYFYMYVCIDTSIVSLELFFLLLQIKTDVPEPMTEEEWPLAHRWSVSRREATILSDCLSPLNLLRWYPWDIRNDQQWHVDYRCLYSTRRRCREA